MKKTVLILIFSLIAVSCLGLSIQTVLTGSSDKKTCSNSRKILPDDYITENQRKIDILHYNLEFDLYPVSYGGPYYLDFILVDTLQATEFPNYFYELFME